MPKLVWSACLAVFAAALILAPAARADEDAGAFDTEHLFAFNSGTDLDAPGSKEISAAVTGRFGRTGGIYRAYDSELSLQYTATRDLQLELAALGTYHRIRNVPDTEDLDRAAFSGLSVGVSYRLLDRATHGIGLAVSAEPYWTRIDYENGERINGYGSEFTIAADMVLVPNILVGVLNVSFEPEKTKSRDDGTWSRENTFGVSGGLMIKLGDNIFAGVEMRYLRHYESLNFNDFAGRVFYLGPTVSISFSENAWLTIGWSAQIDGRAVGDDGALDLINFDRNQARLAIGVTF
jgi:opacity protein-like surface antigen